MNKYQTRYQKYFEAKFLGLRHQTREMRNYLNGPEQLVQIDEGISQLTLPSDIGRLARKMSKSFKSLKADEWKHWTLVYSLFVL